MTVEVDERIWSEWRERSAGEGAEWLLYMLLSPGGADALPAVRDALREVRAPYDERGAPSGTDPPFAGEWETGRVPDGVLIQVTECDVFEAALPALAGALERRGVHGTLSVWQPPPTAELPVTAPLLGCRLCVRGGRERRGPGAYLWRPQREAYLAVLAAAEAWCRRLPAAEALDAGVGGPLRLAPGEPVVDRLVEALRSGTLAYLFAVGGGGFRALSITPYSGRMSLVIGTGEDGTSWREPLAELRELLRAQAGRVAYAFVKPGWSVAGALRRDRLPGDWPVREHSMPRGTWFSPLAFDDLVAPDAFGLQLLGPGFAGRVPTRPGWHKEAVAEDTVLLEHVDPAAWFGAPLTPVGDTEAAYDAPVPELLVAARADLAPILQTPSALPDLGFPDMAGP